jgi:dipeptidyl aminopeptidase/acylaminoacyl peptidase
VRYGVVALVLAACCVALPAAGASAPQRSTLDPGWDEHSPLWSPDGEELLFARGWEGHHAGQRYEVAVLELGRGRRTIGRAPREPGHDWLPEWSPDGELVAFHRTYLDKPGHVFVARTDGSPARRLTQESAAFETAPSWSPDGKRIAYRRDPVGPGPDAIYAVNLDGSDRFRVVEGSELYPPTWSPDGRWIALHRRGRRGLILQVVRPDGTGLRTLGDEDWSLAGWSPDSTRLLLVTGVFEQPSGVVVVRANGSGRIPLGEGTEAAWSPNGRQVAIVRRDGIYVVPAGGGPARRVHSPRGSGLDWSPDGRRIAFARAGDCLAWGLYVLDLARGRASRVTNDCHVLGTPARDVLRGTQERDVIRGRGGSDVLDGNPGDRPIVYYSRLDDDLLEGGPGDDLLMGRRGHDGLRGGPGDDTLLGGRGADRLYGGPGDDVLEGGRYLDRLDGGPGDDVVRARDGLPDRVRCGAGRDRVLADGRDVVEPDCERVERRAA